MSTCQYLERIERWFDGEMAGSQDFEKHLAGCPLCDARLEELKTLRDAVDSLRAREEISDAQFPSFMQSIEERIQPPKRRPVGLWALASVAVAAVVVAFSLISVVSPGPEPLQAVTIEESSTDIDGATTESVYVNEETAMVWINLPDGDML